MDQLGVTARSPRSGYLLCSSPRSGSTLLCDLLTRSGGAGAPASFFRPASISYYTEGWGLGPGSEPWGLPYVKSVRTHGEAGTPHFGMRIMWTDMPAFLDRLAALHPDSGGDRDRLRSTLGIEHFVRLSRADKVAQAVSLVIASQTGLWHRNADGSVREQAESADEAHHEAHYDHGLIAEQLHMLETEERGWQAWLSAQSITPLDVTYEALSLDPTDTARSVLHFIGCTSTDVPNVGTAKLATTRNHEWAARFRSEARPN